MLEETDQVIEVFVEGERGLVAVHKPQAMLIPNRPASSRDRARQLAVAAHADARVDAEPTQPHAVARMERWIDEQFGPR